MGGESWLINDELEWMRKEAIVTKYRVSSMKRPERTEKNQDVSVWVVGLRTEIWTRDLPNTMKEL